MFGPNPDHPLVGPFWRAVAEHRLSLPWCEACDRAVWYPQARCPVCDGELAWRDISGRATLLSWSVVCKPLSPLFEVPYITALVVPDEAPHVRLVTQLVDCDAAQLRCDQPVEVRFTELKPRIAEPFLAPLFTPVAA